MDAQILANAQKGKHNKRVLEGEILPAEPIASDQVSRVRGALTAAYSLAGAVGNRRIQLQTLDGLNALRGLSSRGCA